MMRQVQEESFTNAQHTVEESTHQVVKEMVFDDEYEPLEDVEPCYEENERFKVVLGQSFGLDSQVECDKHFNGCLEEFLFQEEVHESLEPSSSYILYELEPKKHYLYQHHHSNLSLVEVTCQRFPYQVKLKGFHNQDPYVTMHVIYYWHKPLFDKHLSPSLILFLVCFPFSIFLFLCVLFCCFK